MAHKVFICHSAKDKRIADVACAALEQRRIPCWIAPRDILAGEEYGKSIIEALASCQIVLLIFSAHANDSPQVRREIERAVSKGKIIVPFRIEDVMPSDAMEFALSNTHWLDALTPPLERYLLELCDTIARLMQKRTVADAPLWTPAEPVVEDASTVPAPIPAESGLSREIQSEEAAGKAGPKPVVEPAPEAVDRRTANAKNPAVKPSWRSLPGWAWGVLAIVVLFGIFTVGRQFGPAQPPRTSQQQDLALKERQADALYSQKNFAAAAPLYDQGCAGGMVVACGRLGYMYYFGFGVALNYSQAFALDSKACNGGDGAGCANLGLLYANGAGVAQSYTQAAASFSKACNGGYAGGCGLLGDLYRLGHGVAVDSNKARQLLTKGCSMGSQWSCGQLKQMQ